jgi:hypothetical protein
MAVDIKFLIDGADRGQPTNAEDFSVNVSEDKTINARIVSFDNDLTFVGGVYDYLFSKLDQSGFCNLIVVEVQYQCAGVWKRLTNGYIILSECNFLLDKCQVKTKLYDESFSTKINNNKGIPFSLSCTITKNLLPVVPPRLLGGRFFIPSTGSHVGDLIYGNLVYDAFQHLITCMSDGQIDFESSFFAYDLSVSSDILLITNGDAIRIQGIRETVVTFEELYLSMHKKFNLGMVFEKQANGRPLLRIEQASYFIQQGATVNLYDQPNITLSFDRERLYSAVHFGSSPVLEKEECTGGVCTFSQTPFRGFRDETFGFTGECNTSNILDLQTNNIVFDTNVIEDVFVFNAEDRKLNPFIVQCDWFASTQLYNAATFDPYGTGQTVYNGDLRNLYVSNNWISGYPNSLYSFLESGVFPNSPDFLVRSNYSPNPTFPIQFTIFNSYFEQTGNYITFPTEVQDPFNYFSGDSYVVPFAGIYTIRLGVVLADLGSGSSGEHEGYANLLHFSSSGTLITSYNGAPFIQPSFNGFMIDVTATFIANQGDILRGDVWCRANFANFGPQPIANFINLGGGVIQYTEMSGSAVPINPNNPAEELEPVNIDDVRAYIYSFDRPLRMEEIEAILDNTSRPIKFGNYDDPLRVIEGYINKVDIKSIIKQDASITLKSNKILR